MQSTTRQDAPPRPEGTWDEGVLFVDFEIDGGEVPALMTWCTATLTWYGTPCAVHLWPGVASFSPLRVTVALFLAPSSTETSVTALTARLRRSLRHWLKRSETWQPTVSWAPSLWGSDSHEIGPTA